MAVAERLPLRARTFDVLTVSSGVHWFDQQQFFAEASRVLKPEGWLVVYDHIFEGGVDQPDFNEWFETSYARRYPCACSGLFDTFSAFTVV
jgi:ubiquinone/menaquinone biosynthesis C-methylase UbiE